jgi:CubicO group peptidase (beta-lactamase class C family)
MTFFDIFTHQSRLYPWIPFYKLYENELGDLNDTIFSSIKSKVFSLKVADNLFFREDYLDSIVNNILEYPLLEKKEYRYSDLGFYLFYKILKDHIKISTEDYLRENFYYPIDALRLGYNPIEYYSKNGIIPTENDKVFRKQLLKGYVHDPGVELFGGVGLHAGLFSNAIDLAKFMQIYLNNGTYSGDTIFDNYSIDFFTSSQFRFTDNRRGIFFDKPTLNSDEEGPTSEYVSLQSYGHTGFTGTMVWADPKDQIIFIFLSNRIHPDQNNKKLIDEDVRTKIQSIIYESIIR